MYNSSCRISENVSEHILLLFKSISSFTSTEEAIHELVTNSIQNLCGGFNLFGSYIKTAKNTAKHESEIIVSSHPSPPSIIHRMASARAKSCTKSSKRWRQASWLHNLFGGISKGPTGVGLLQGWTKTNYKPTRQCLVQCEKVSSI